MHRILSARVIFYLFLLLIIELTILPVFRIGSIQPQLLYLMILYVAFQWGWQKTIPMALTVGILRDLAGSQYFGYEAMALVLTSWLLDLLVRSVERDSWSLKMVTAFLFVFLVTMFHMMLLSVLTPQTYVSWHWCGINLATALYTALLLPFFFHFTAKWFGDRVTFKQYELFQ